MIILGISIPLAEKNIAAMLADHSKFEQESFIQIAPIKAQQIDHRQRLARPEPFAVQRRRHRSDQ